MTNQSPSSQQPQPPFSPNPRPPRKRRRWPWILAIVVAFFLGLGIGGAGNTPAPAGTAGAKATTTLQTLSTVPTTVPTTTTTVEPQRPKTTIKDGMYLVGKDVEAGKYMTTGPTNHGLPCYWKRSKGHAGSLDDIIANGLPDGQAYVEIVNGEYFETSRCAAWVKQ